jgi:hypothetical protein
MALKQTVVTPQDFDAPDAYHRVENVALKSKTELVFMVVSYKTKEHSASFNQQPHKCTYEMDGSNPIRQAYVHLKTLPEFENATDC